MLLKKRAKAQKSLTKDKFIKGCLKEGQLQQTSA